MRPSAPTKQVAWSAFDSKSSQASSARKEAPSADIGERPDLATLGPIEFRAWQAGDWTARTGADEPVDGHALRGRPHLLLLTLGKACSHCNDQIKAFAAKAPDFAAAGVPVLVLTTDTPTEIREAGESLPFPVHSGADGAAFRALDAWDDFEAKPLHATCFVGADGRMRWQHVGYEPFMLPDFLLEEIRRLVSTPEDPDCLLRR